MKQKPPESAIDAALHHGDKEFADDPDLARLWWFIKRFMEEDAKRKIRDLEARLAEYRDPNTSTPEVLFPEKFVPCRDADTFRREVLKLLRSWWRYGLPLSEQIFQVVEDEELRWLFWPDLKAKRRRRMQELRSLVDMAEIINRRRGIKQPRRIELEYWAKELGHNSGDALRKALQPNRVNRRPRRKPRG